MATITVDLSVAINGGTPVSQQTILSAESALPVQVTVPADSEDLEISPLAIDISQLKALQLLATADMTINTNDLAGGSPDDTIELEANKSLVWYEGCGLANPLTVDVTKFYVTSVDGGTLNVTVGQDVTP